MTVPAPATGVPPYVLITGPEGVLVERAVAVHPRRPARRRPRPRGDPPRRRRPTSPGRSPLHASPSLFGGDKAIVVRDLDEASDELQLDLLSLPRGARPTTSTLVVAHGGGMRGKKVLDTMKKAGPGSSSARPSRPTATRPTSSSTSSGRQGRKVTPGGACAPSSRPSARTCASSPRPAPSSSPTPRAWSTTRSSSAYHGGKVEATGFRVADAAVAGQSGEALRLLRHAIAHRRRPGPDRGRPRLASCASSGQGRRRRPWQLGRSWPRASAWRRGRSTRRAGRSATGPPTGSPGHPGRRRRRLRGQGRRPRPRVRRRAGDPHHRRRARRERADDVLAEPVGRRPLVNLTVACALRSCAYAAPSRTVQRRVSPRPVPSRFCRPLTATVRPNERKHPTWQTSSPRSSASRPTRSAPSATRRSRASFARGSASSARPPSPATRTRRQDALKAASTQARQGRQQGRHPQEPGRQQEVGAWPRRSPRSDPTQWSRRAAAADHGPRSRPVTPARAAWPTGRSPEGGGPSSYPGGWRRAAPGRRNGCANLGAMRSVLLLIQPR